MLDPRNDGVTHINIYSKGKTALGRALSNFAHFPFECEDGKFNSVEGYWYWLSTKDDRLRSLSGLEAKQVGRELRGDDWNNSEEFQAKIRGALRIKLDSMKEQLRMSTLKFVHYYVYNGKVSQPKEGQWIVDFITEFRASLSSERANKKTWKK